MNYNSIPTEIIDTILGELKIGLTLVNSTGKVIYFNQLASELLGWDEKLPENNVLFCHKEENQPKVMEKLNQPATMEWHRVLRSQHRYIENTYSQINIPDKFIGAMILSRDVTEREESLEELKNHAATDSLTGLHNRSLFHTVIQNYIAESKPYGLIMLDISGLKYINDHFGHEEGDRILKEAADAIQSSIRDTDFAFRFGGDEFLILTSHKETVLKTIENRIRSRNKIPSKHTPAVLNLSIGYATSLEEKNMEAVLSLADQRMYQDKQLFYSGDGKYFKRQ